MSSLMDVINGNTPFWPWFKGILVYLVTILIIILLAYIIRKAVIKIFNHFMDKRHLLNKKIKTIKTLFNQIFTVIIYFIALVLILQVLNINTTAFLAVSSVLAVAFSLGAQDVVKDYISGFLFMVEDQYNIGDYIEVKGEMGKVETLNLRTTSIRSADGSLHIFPNSEIDYVTNITKDFSMAVIEVEVDYNSDVDMVINVLNDELGILKKEVKDIVDVAPVAGISSFKDSGLLFKLFITCNTETQWIVGQKVRVEVKNRFDKEGISIPYPHTTVEFKNKIDEPNKKDL